jgi:mRNA interferase MazF
MRRGDLITVAASGDYGKPRPAIIIQSDHLSGSDSVLVALITSAIADAPIYRLTINPTEENGLKVVSQIMVDKILAIPRSKCGPVIGLIDSEAMGALNQMLLVTIGLAD